MMAVLTTPGFSVTDIATPDEDVVFLDDAQEAGVSERTPRLHAQHEITTSS